MNDPFTISLTAVVRALPQTSRIVHGHTQPPTLARFVAGDLAVARHLGELFDAILDRSQSEREQDEADVVVELIALEWQARKAARRGVQAVDVRTAVRAEQPDDAALDAAQLEAMAPDAGPSAWYRLRDCALKHARRAMDIAHAAKHEIARAETRLS